jgi:hypothetical protein
VLPEVADGILAQRSAKGKRGCDAPGQIASLAPQGDSRGICLPVSDLLKCVSPLVLDAIALLGFRQISAVQVVTLHSIIISYCHKTNGPTATSVGPFCSATAGATGVEPQCGIPTGPKGMSGMVSLY